MWKLLSALQDAGVSSATLAWCLALAQFGVLYSSCSKAAGAAGAVSGQLRNETEILASPRTCPWRGVLDWPLKNRGRISN